MYNLPDVLYLNYCKKQSNTGYLVDDNLSLVLNAPEESIFSQRWFISEIWAGVAR